MSSVGFENGGKFYSFLAPPLQKVMKHHWVDQIHLFHILHILLLG